MNNALIGYTGFVGGNILRQSGDTFTDLYRSTNITDIANKAYDLLVCAGIPAEAWRANQEPEKDMANIQALLDVLATVSAKQCVLISTVDVFADPVGVDERTPVDPSTASAYGANRFAAEEFFRSHFSDVTVMRLAGLFGEGLKKNLIFDLLTGNDPNEFTNKDSVFQFYDLSRIWSDMQRALEQKIALLHCTAEPLSAAELAQEVFGQTLVGNPEKPVRQYDFKTIHDATFGGTNGYLYSKAETIERVQSFVATVQAV